MNRKRLDQKQDLELFRSNVKTHNLRLNDRTIDRLTVYRDLMISWNDRVRLVSRSDGSRIMSRHVLESMMILKHIEPDATRLVDIGTGGGLPGIPLHIARPDLRVSLIESARMKALFLNEVVRTMSLDQVEVIHDRAESFSMYRRGTFDVATSRAVSSLDRVWELAEPLLKPQGTMISLKGPGEAEGELGSLGIEFLEHLVELEDRILAVVVVRKG